MIKKRYSTQRYSAQQIRQIKNEFKKDISILRGYPPHDTWSNISYGDGYFAASILRRARSLGLGDISIDDIYEWACDYDPEKVADVRVGGPFVPVKLEEL